MSQALQYIAEKVKFFRKQNDLTLEQLAERSNLTLNYLWHIEKGSVNVTINKLESICMALNIDLVQLMPGSDFVNEDISETQKINSLHQKELISRITRLCTMINNERDLKLVARLLESMRQVK